MKSRTLGMLATGLVASVTWPAVSHATVVFSEDFSALSGTPISPEPNPTDSERGQGTYFNVTSGLTPGWTLEGDAGQILGFERNDGSNNALLINEMNAINGISRVITGLVAGQAYVLSFEYWGDNRKTPDAYSFSYEIDGVTTGIGPVSSANFNTGAFYTVTYGFIADSNSTTLRFTELSGSSASPIFDNISISSIPEPASLALLGLGLLGLGVARRRRAN